jgi:hypothetical protein
MSVQELEQAPGAVSDRELRDKVEAARRRGASEGEIVALVKKYAPGGNLCDIPPWMRAEFLAASEKIGCPAHFFPIAQRLIDIAADHDGKFVLCGFGEAPDTGKTISPQIEHLPNKGEPAFMYRQFGSAIRRLGKTPGLNTYVMPSLVLADLPEGQRGKESDVTGVLALVLDFDGKHDPATRHDRLPVEPHAEVETSPGNFQCWYFLDKPYSVAEVKPIIAALVAKVASDPACKSADHPFRIPGTLNWPNATKRARGRSAEPVMAQLTEWYEEILIPNYSLDQLKASILAKWPDAFNAQTAVATTIKEFDWDQRCAALTPMNEDDSIKILNDPKYDRDRSEGAWAFSCAAMRRGHSPDEVVELMLEHADTLCMGHYGDQPDEARIRADVRRAFVKEAPRKAMQEVVGQLKAGTVPRIITIKQLCEGGTSLTDLYQAMNEVYAVARYGSEPLVIELQNDAIDLSRNLLSPKSFNDMFANMRARMEVKSEDEDKAPTVKYVEVSKAWLKWKGRREYLDPGIVFEPGSPPEAPGKLNLWRGFSVEPKQGDWSLLREHILKVVCSGDVKLFDYTIKWMAAGVQHPERRAETAIALRGKQGAGKGIVFRTYGELFGSHFVHITRGEQLIGRFNASLANKCAIFLDEALWGGDKQTEGVLKALITEPSFQLEAKFRDPITMPNKLRIMIASNSTWFVPTGTDDRRFLILDVADTYAGTGHEDYWKALHAQIGEAAPDGGSAAKAAMLHELLHLELNGFNIRAVPNTAAKTEQKMRALRGTTDGWLVSVLQAGAIGTYEWGDSSLQVPTNYAYEQYCQFAKERREHQPEIKALWSKTLREILDDCVDGGRPTTNGTRVRAFVFRSLAECRVKIEKHLRADGMMEWEDA